MAILDSVVERERPDEVTTQHFDVIVIGGGQTGLAVGYYLAREGLRFVILDERDRVGDIWRSRWDSLRLFSPARYDALPGIPFPAPPHTFPTRDDMADYLEAYAAKMNLPVQTGIRVDDVWQVDGAGSDYIVAAGDRRFLAPQVVIATGAQEGPHVPGFAGELDPGIRQFHSSDYRNPSQFAPGDVLIVGAGNSGAEIALESVRAHRTLLAGPETGHVPFRIETRSARVIVRGLWFVANHVLTWNTPIGRKVGPAIRGEHGGPLVRVKPADLRSAGVEWSKTHVTGVRDGLPILEDGRVVEVRNVVWCTGFRNTFDWIHLPVIGEDGYPIQRHGVVPDAPGLYFIGLPFLYSFSSMLIGGAGRDAAYISRAIAVRTGAAQRGQGAMTSRETA